MLKSLFFLNFIFLRQCQYQLTMEMWFYFWTLFCSNTLWVCLYASTIFLNYHIFVIYFEIRKYSAFSFALLLQYFRLLGTPLCFHRNLMILFYFVKNAIGILIVIVLNLHIKNFLYTVDRNSVATIETVWRFPKKLKREMPYDTVISLLCIHPKLSK